MGHSQFVFQLKWWRAWARRSSVPEIVEIWVISIHENDRQHIAPNASHKWQVREFVECGRAPCQAHFRRREAFAEHPAHGLLHVTKSTAHSNCEFVLIARYRAQLDTHHRATRRIGIRHCRGGCGPILTCCCGLSVPATYSSSAYAAYPGKTRHCACSNAMHLLTILC